MPKEKSLVRGLSVRASGKQHRCSQSKVHALPKGYLMLVVTEGRNEKHYCTSCAVRFVATARRRLDEVLTELGLSGTVPESVEAKA
jgi:hypothetical protein